MSTLTFFRPGFALTQNAGSHSYGGACETKPKSTSETLLHPRVDVIQTDTHVELEFELPGVSKENIEVAVENQILKVKATKSSRHNPEEADYRLRERAFGTYERSFRLAEHLDSEQIQAGFKDGILNLRIARKETSLARKVEVLEG
jgi:HSP20 family protein